MVLKFLFGCISSYLKPSANEGSKNLGFTDYISDDSSEADEKQGMSIVELIKKEGSTLGIILAGGADKGTRARITNLRPGSIAHRSDALCVGDFIVGVNGIRTDGLKHDEIVNLLKNAEERVILDVEYDIPDSPVEAVMCVFSKAVQIRLKKENGSFGFTVRGGVCDEKIKTRPLIITQVRPGGSADREGTIKPGDRLLAVDNFNLINASHSEALCILKQLDGDSIFTIEYDVSVMDAVKKASGPLLVEIEKTPGSSLGIALAASNGSDSNPIIIESIKQASIAERSGALHVGDQILAIDGTRVDQMSPAEVTQLIKLSLTEVIKMEILPLRQMVLQRVSDSSARRGTRTPPGLSTSSKGLFYNSNSNYNTLSSMTGLSARYSRNKRKNLVRNNSLTDTTVVSGMSPCPQVCHIETTEVSLLAGPLGYGFTIKPGTFTSDMLVCFPVIANIDPASPAEKTGVMQIGDRLIAVNRQKTNQLTIDEIIQLINESKPRVLLELEFDVAESVVPSSGTFSVKLNKHGGGLGISITAPKNRKLGDGLMISHVKKGSVADRSGTIQPGDQLLAIDSVRMENCTIEDAAQILHDAKSIVQLRIKKDDDCSEDSDNNKGVVYTMELQKHGGPLGITLSGTEEPFDPIVISGLTSNGLAEKTGALHVGDRLLAINGESLRGKALSEAIQMLQNSGDIVTLKICKNYESRSNLEKSEAEPGLETYKISTPLPSIDSAVESWDSSGIYDANHSGTCSRATSSRPNSEEGICGVLSNKRASDVFDLHEESALTSWRREKWKQDSPKKNSGSSTSDNNEEDWSKVLEDLETCGQSLILRQLEKSIMGSDDDAVSMSTTSAFETVKRNPNISLKSPQGCGSLRYDKWKLQQAELDNLNSNISGVSHSGTKLIHSSLNNADEFRCSGSDVAVPQAVEIHKVTLFKDSVYEDFGFSVSDGLYEKGVFVNRIRPGGPAELCGLLKPFDKILQVNGTKTEDFDCCLTVPLIAAAGDQIEMLFSRNPENINRGCKLVSHDNNSDSWKDVNCSSPESPLIQTKTL